MNLMNLKNVAKLNNQCIAKNWFECIEHFESYECSKAYMSESYIL